MIALNLAIVLIVGGGTAAYGTMSNKVTLDVDGEQHTVRTFNNSVGEVLAARDVTIRPADRVNFDPTHQLSDGDTVEIEYAKPVTLSVDGTVTTHTVYTDTVGDALDDLGVDVPSTAYLSEKPSEDLSRSGNTLVVSTSKDLVVDADGEKQQITTTRPTVAGVLEEVGVALGSDDEVEPGILSYVKADQVIKVVRITSETKTETVPVDFETESSDDPEAMEGEVEVLTPGVKGEKSEKVELVYADGKLRDRTVLSSQVVKEPVTQVEKRGTSTTPPDSVWDKIAQCESGGNWSINTGNGYYGGLQFSAATWRSVGGPGLPHQNSREVQIKYAKILQARAGWGQWGCAGARFN